MQEFVHYPNANASCETNFLIELRIGVRELSVARWSGRPFGRADRNDQRSGYEDGRPPVWANLFFARSRSLSYRRIRGEAAIMGCGKCPFDAAGRGLHVRMICERKRQAEDS